MKQIVELRKTNLSLGNYEPDYQTMTAKTFHDKTTGQREKTIENDLKSTHF